MGTSLNLANQNFPLPSYTSSTRTGILQWPNPDEEDEECVISVNKVPPGN
jgi:hypothetical protein